MKLKDFNRATEIRKEQNELHDQLKRLHKFAEPMYSNMFQVEFCVVHGEDQIEHVGVPLPDDTKTEMAALAVENCMARFDELKEEFNKLGNE